MVQTHRVVGLDWAVEPKNRAAVILTAGVDHSIALEEIVPSVDTRKVLEFAKCRDVSHLAVDTPFGWPIAFSSFVTNWKLDAESTCSLPESIDFRYRLTDRIVHKEAKKAPLSVSSNLIGVSALAWAQVVHKNRLKSQIDVVGADVDCSPTIIEVYPGATLVMLFPKNDLIKTDGYKADGPTRQQIVEALAKRFSIGLSQSQIEQLVSVGTDSDKTDAFVAALTALIRAGRIPGWGIRTPRSDELSSAQAEGWIFFPIKQYISE